MIFTHRAEIFLKWTVLTQFICLVQVIYFKMLCLNENSHNMYIEAAKLKKKCTIRVDRKDNICMVVLTPSDYVMCAIWR